MIHIAYDLFRVIYDRLATFMHMGAYSLASAVWPSPMKISPEVNVSFACAALSPCLNRDQIEGEQ